MNTVPIKSLNGYTVCEVFVQDASGTYIHVGFGVFDPDGNFLAAFADLRDALDYLERVAAPALEPPSRGFGTPSRGFGM